MKNSEKLSLPEKIQNLTAYERYSIDDIGMSESSILLFEDKVLKIQSFSKEVENEYRMMTYLQGKLPVPKVYVYETQGGRSYLLMEKCKGQMACDDIYMQNPPLLCRLLASGLKKMWSIDIADCPCDQRLTHKLAQARYNVEHGLVDLDNVEPSTFGEGGFENPEALLAWLYQHQPEEEPVLSHGDYCLPNIFGRQTEVSGFIDLGKTGIADKWCDIAICYRSLSHNYSGKYKHVQAVYPGYDDTLLFRELGIEPDWEKIRYYILLDELF
ncbi:MAG: aminoglycoside 3'-phosphotransferase [Ruminococcus sp.]|nr:aminoglycoside 3'-phosphotransferase [Ruminococcus sp.]